MPTGQSSIVPVLRHGVVRRWRELEASRRARRGAPVSGRDRDRPVAQVAACGPFSVRESAGRFITGTSRGPSARRAERAAVHVNWRKMTTSPAQPSGSTSSGYPSPLFEAMATFSDEVFEATQRLLRAQQQMTQTVL